MCLGQKQRSLRGRERQRTVKYLVLQVGYGPEHDTWCEHPWFVDEAGGRLGIDAWLARNASIPGPVTRDRAGRHRNRAGAPP